MGITLNHESIARSGPYRDMDLTGMERDTLQALLRQMLRLRRTEEALLHEYHPADEMRCPIHFCIGQEAVPAALSLLVRPDDYMLSHHRSHGYYFAKGAPLRELFAEIYGKATGASGGLAGSQDISHHESQFYSGAILAGAVSIAVGVALGLQIRKSTSIAISGFGEGASDEGAFWEAMNYAGVARLPILFVCENNRYATFSDQLKRQASDNMSERVKTFGVRATRIFGNDAPLVYRTLRDEVRRIRGGEGPALVEAYTYRWNSHVGPEDDGVNNYRTPEEMAFWKENCPIRLLQGKLRESGQLSEGDVEHMEAETAQEIADCFRYAKESPFPDAPDWKKLNWSSESPVADKLLGTRSGGEFDQFQSDARLAPY
jgi:TPP-dependent pyruvate/acetoin dehydrogenase alpha subunit